MTPLLVWLLALPAVRDGHGFPIPISHAAAEAIAAACSDKLCAARLFVIGAHESGYRANAIGDAGKSCGLGQTPCAITPRDLLGQARLMVKILDQAERACPGHAVRAYASGRCVYSHIAALYEKEIEAIQ